MSWIRASLFYLGLSLCTVCFLPACLFLWPFPYATRYRFITLWVDFNLWWLGVTCGLRHRVEGAENIPERPTVVMCKHQSAWETIAVNQLFRPQVWVLKRELLRIPLLGWGLATLRPIAIDRSAGRNAAEQIYEQGRQRLESGCWVVIFPEGTRVAPGVRGRYRSGAARLAIQAGYPVVPVAHNAGDYWPRNGFRKRPGNIRLVIGPIIETGGRQAAEVTAEVEQWIENTVQRLRSEDGHQTQSTERPLHTHSMEQ